MENRLLAHVDIDVCAMYLIAACVLLPGCYGRQGAHTAVWADLRAAWCASREAGVVRLRAVGLYGPLR